MKCNQFDDDLMVLQAMKRAIDWRQISVITEERGLFYVKMIVKLAEKIPPDLGVQKRGL